VPLHGGEGRRRSGAGEGGEGEGRGVCVYAHARVGAWVRACLAGVGGGRKGGSMRGRGGGRSEGGGAVPVVHTVDRICDEIARRQTAHARMFANTVQRVKTLNTVQAIVWLIGPSLGADVARPSPVPVQMWQGRAQARCRSGKARSACSVGSFIASIADARAPETRHHAHAALCRAMCSAAHAVLTPLYPVVCCMPPARCCAFHFRRACISSLKSRWSRRQI
jgi:hypothetical protein